MNPHSRNIPVAFAKDKEAMRRVQFLTIRVLSTPISSPHVEVGLVEPVTTYT